MVAATADWLSILQSQVARSNVTQVAEKIGYARSSVSLALHGRYVGSTDKLREAVLSAFGDGHHCPFLKRLIDPVDCQDFQAARIPQSSAQALRHWRACQACPHSQRKDGASFGGGVDA